MKEPGVRMTYCKTIESAIRYQLKKRRKALHRLEPDYIRCIILATGIFCDAVESGSVDYSTFDTRTTNFDNAAEFRVSVNSNGFYFHFIDFHFIWFAESDGIMETYAELFINGAWEMYNPGDCWDDNGCAIRLWTDFSVAQTDASGIPRSVAGSPREPLFDETQTNDGSSSESNAGLFLPDRDCFTLEGPTMEIVPDLPVLFTVTIGLELEANNGASAEANFREGPYEINVGLVSCRVLE